MSSSTPLQPHTHLNLRDLGGHVTADGHVVRHGLLYRSAALERARGAHLRLVHSLDLRTLIDLRAPDEVPRRDPLSGVRRLALTIDIAGITRQRLRPHFFRGGAEEEIIVALDSVYGDMVDLAVPQLSALFAALLDPATYPALICCRAGKDRTGFASALILLALGVSREAVMADYLRSNAFVRPRTSRMRLIVRLLTLGLYKASNLWPAFAVQERYLNTALARIEQGYGGIGPYLAACGLDDEARRRLRALLLRAR
jgi:protein-tyrosine phosphatase